MSDITNSTATLIGSNVVVYSNCFASLQGDLALKVTPAGLAQDVVIRESLSWIPFDEIGFDPKSTVLEAWTEFYDGPSPEKQTATVAPRASADGPTSEISDETLKFGDVIMVPGRAYVVPGSTGSSSATAPASLRDSLPVGKTWQEQDSRRFLIERLRWREVLEQFKRLETNAAVDSAKVETQAPRRSLSVADSPPKLIASATALTNRAVLLAEAPAAPEPAFVLDYTTATCSGGICNGYRFEAHETYYISGPITIQGEAVLVGGTVIKISSSDSTAGITFSGTVTCDTGLGRIGDHHECSR